MRLICSWNHCPGDPLFPTGQHPVPGSLRQEYQCGEESVTTISPVVLKVFHTPAASVSPGSSLEIQILRPNSRHTVKGIVHKWML